MIDIEKLHTAKELIKPLSNIGWFFRQYVKTCYDETETIEEVTYLLGHPNEYDEEFDDIDSLIKRLKELSKQYQPYNVGDKVWVVGISGGFHSTRIKKISGMGNYLLHGHFEFVYTANNIYRSKEALIDAQISYWLSLKIDSEPLGKIKTMPPIDEFKSECEHKFPGGGSGKDFSPKIKCEKCGEFYK